MPRRDTEFINHLQTPALQFVQIFLCRPIPQHALHVMLQLVRTVHTIQGRNYGVSGCEVVDDFVE